jgi:PTH1 family peptidyl-tRNA hydrolase
MKLVVGLGNPGRKYEATRHNVGFDVANELARRGGSSAPRAAFEALATETQIGSERVLLLWPQTFMNLSGASALKAKDFYKLAPTDVLVVCDDFNLPLGRLRLRERGSAGGQKGLADVIRRLGTDEVSRLRLGVGPVPAAWDPADFVLARFAKHEQPLAAEMIVRAADAVGVWAQHGPAAAMNRYNTAEP